MYLSYFLAVRIYWPHELSGMISVITLSCTQHTWHRCRRCLFTRILFNPFVTNFALHVTAPVELASALPRTLQLTRVVAATTAQQVAAIQTRTGRPITMPAVGAQRSQPVVLFAIVGRMLQIDKLHALRLRHGQRGGVVVVLVGHSGSSADMRKSEWEWRLLRSTQPPPELQIYSWHMRCVFVSVYTIVYLLKTRLSPWRACNGCTRRARLYFFIRTSPTRRNDGKVFQHVRIAQEPLTPWHLHSVFSNDFTTYDTDDKHFYSIV